MNKNQTKAKYFTTEQLATLAKTMKDHEAGLLTDEQLREQVNELLKQSDKNK